MGKIKDSDFWIFLSAIGDSILNFISSTIDFFKNFHKDFYGNLVRLLGILVGVGSFIYAAIVGIIDAVQTGDYFSTAGITNYYASSLGFCIILFTIYILLMLIWIDFLRSKVGRGRKIFSCIMVLIILATIALPMYYAVQAAMAGGINDLIDPSLMLGQPDWNAAFIIYDIILGISAIEAVVLLIIMWKTKRTDSIIWLVDVILLIFVNPMLKVLVPLGLIFGAFWLAKLIFAWWVTRK